VSIRSPQPSRGITIFLCLLVAVLWVGCDRSAADKKPPADQTQDESDTHADHAVHAGEKHALPETFTKGVSELKEHYLEIKKAFEQADIKQAVELAHEPLHTVGEILEVLPELAKQGNLSPEDLQTVDESVDAMFDGYGSVDDAVHEGREPDYKAVAAKIDTAMAAIEAVRAPQEK